VGIIGHDRVLVSLAAPHFINQFIKENKKLSINIVDESYLPEEDYVGSVSGAKDDKSTVFDYEMSEAGVPIIKKAPLTIDCAVEDIYNTNGFESFICSITGTYVEEEHLNDAGKINYQTLKPVLFEFPTYEYLKTGDVIGGCLTMKKNPNE
jgi:flavin reductase (DIM6/NTAB) family NADH-FMN oxidoreductase RutF